MNEVCQARDPWLTWDEEPAAKIIPESDAEFGGCVHQAEEGVATVAPGIAGVPPLILRLMT